MNNEIVVSICCMTFNQKSYIGQTLKSFLNQQVEFKYEIIVHDDASTDGTTEILKEFQEKYPDIVKPVYQTVNQYSKGKNILKDYIIPVSKGTYLAFCEGDDFWCDKMKLQRQVDFLNQHKNYSACVHNTSIWNQETNSINQKINKLDFDVQNITIEHILKWDANVPFHTSSIVCRKSIFGKELPEFFTIPKSFGDYPLALYMAMEGKIYYSNDTMSVYRLLVPNSYSNRIRSINFQIRKESEKLHMLKEFNRYSKYQYNGLIEEEILKIEFRLNIEKPE